MAMLEVRHLKKYFKTPRGPLHAVEDVSFDLEEGKTLGVVGESGCGKSTLGRVILGLSDATEGEVRFRGEETTHLKPAERKALRKKMQIIFQDPFSSLDPRMCVRDLIAEPLEIFGMYRTKDEIYDRVAELMDTVGLAERFDLSYPHELDGGRRQRIGIARALAVNPEFIVCDEPVSALDVSIQAQILNLLQQLQRTHGLSYLFITHNLSVVKHISDDIMVMYLGQVIEKAEAEELFTLIESKNFFGVEELQDRLTVAKPLKEIIVSNIIEKARLLAEYADPDEAFDDYSFQHGDGPGNSYNQWVKKYHRLKNKKISGYSILVASSNNTAVENITKELPLEEKIIGDLVSSEKNDGPNDAALDELTGLFTVSESRETLPFRQKIWEEYTNEKGEKKARLKEIVMDEPDIYFSRFATDLLNDEFGKQEKQQAFGLISASLGKKVNISRCEGTVLFTAFFCVRSASKIGSIVRSGERIYQCFKKGRGKEASGRNSAEETNSAVI